MRVTTRKGFTLVELLVVIGIIAVLISILLPSLAKARQAAVTLQCLSNLRAMGQGIVLYANENKGYLPYGWRDTNDAQGNHTISLCSTIQQVLGQGDGFMWGNNPQVSTVIRCPAAAMVPLQSWVPGGTYAGHPLCFGSADWGHFPTSAIFDTNRDGTQLQVIPIFKLASLRNATEKALIMDATQVTNDVGNGAWTFPSVYHIDGDQYWWGDYLIEQQEGWQSWLRGNNGYMEEAANVTIGIYDHPTADTGRDNFNLRFRHGNNNQGNILFGDGHAETFSISPNGTSDLKHKNFAIFYNPPGLISPP